MTQLNDMAARRSNVEEDRRGEAPLMLPWDQ